MNTLMMPQEPQLDLSILSGHPVRRQMTFVDTLEKETDSPSPSIQKASLLPTVAAQPPEHEQTGLKQTGLNTEPLAEPDVDLFMDGSSFMGQGRGRIRFIPCLSAFFPSSHKFEIFFGLIVFFFFPVWLQYLILEMSLDDWTMGRAE
ncbi:hypothetical protein E5288_WYG005059 [Bos mutus]|uniref:Uncharacterized protein n=1 Tax=Bos mutus TaxID=72004 RepID=A0A6B0S7A2_9CETA|nr:hypothetical protein [Bos mutus]